jgi:SAM-dependent methyltransferase
MCVLEHIGLGRYGDPLNPNGTEEAVREITRVLQPGGIVIFSVPVGREVLEFNAHRRFTHEQALNLFKGFTLVDSCILNPVPRRFESEEALKAMVDPVVCICCRKPSSGH